MKNVDIVVGTRPETIKMATVYLALTASGGLKVRLISTGQHRELQSQAMASFGLTPDIDLNLMAHGQSLSRLTGRILASLEDLYQTSRPDLLMVHGDTTTAFSTALAGFYQGIPVAHVEAGLRTHDLASPFPEEFNRQMTAQMVRYHFAVDESAKSNLVSEGISPCRVRVTGNTIGDALAKMLPATPTAGDPSVLVTLHRRENRAETLLPLLGSVRRLAEQMPQTPFVYPVHPALGSQVKDILGGTPNIRVVEPLAYPAFLGELLRAQVVITDSGGVQEEAYQLGRPVVLLREQSEREDGVSEGRVVYAGTASLDQAVKRLMQVSQNQRRLRTGASQKIADGVQGILK